VSKLEDVALAIKRFECGPTSLLSKEGPWRRYELNKARAAIEAMRDVPDVCYDGYRCDKLWRDLNSKEVWNLWIDASLADDTTAKAT
jgi:hypothetical protein